MKTKDKKKTSSKRKLAPAIAMLTTSAVMLTTATYAWFTIGKEAQVTGLEMSATAGGGLEISLGKINASKLSAPGMADGTLWKSSCSVAEVYKSVGKINPASTVDGNNLYYVESGVGGQGKTVSDTSVVKQATDSAKLTLQTENTANADKTTSSEDGAGHYVDIPMWIRTTSAVDQNIKCAVTIDNTADNQGTDLKKAVRVAVIPVSTSKNDSVSKKDTTGVTLSTSSTYTDTIKAIFGLDQTGYNENKGISKEKTASDPSTYSAILGAVSNFKEAGATASDVFDLAKATSGNYSVQGFVVRVWLEGESTSCWDENAGQDWNISLKFTADDAQS